MYEGLVFQIYFCLNDYYLNPNFDWATRIVWVFETALLIFMIAALDASSLGYNFKWMMAMVLASAFTLCAVAYRFGWFGYGEHKINIEDATEVATQESFVGAAQGLAIFYWQQTFAIFRGGPTGQSVTVTYNPYIQWVLHGDDEAEAGKGGKGDIVIDSLEQTVQTV